MSDTTPQGCHLIGGAFAYILQGFLALAAITGLLVKRQYESPRRPFKVWWYDVSKQGFGSLFIHLWNIIMSIALADMAAADMAAGGDAGGNDECALYFMNFFFDCVLGVILIWIWVIVQEMLAHKFNVPSLATSGDYGVPPSFSWYKAQLMVYMLSLLVIKSIISVVFVAAIPVVRPFSTWLFRPVSEYPDVELTIVMIICPWFLNAAQF